jgi:hypothetical protein
MIVVSESYQIYLMLVMTDIEGGGGGGVGGGDDSESVNV